LRPDGAIECWGSSTLGETTPPAGSFVALSAGVSHSCAIRADATHVCWGLNSAGQCSEVR
jgi:alpha-tubulin suppressor-like RCC1 family protein